jgi:hypothetical protein
MPRIVDAVTGVFLPSTQVEEEKAEAAVTTTTVQLEDDRQSLALALDEGADTGLTEELQARIRGLRQNIADLEAILERQQRKLATARQAHDEFKYKKERDAQQEINKGKVRAACNHLAEAVRQLKLLPDLLAQVHKVLEESSAAVDRSELVTGAPEAVRVPMLAGRAIAAAGLREWLQDALRAFDSDYSGRPVQALGIEVDEAVSAATNEFEYSLGLKDRPIHEPTPEELAAQAAEEQTRRDQAEHQRRVNEDPGYYAAQFMTPGRHTIIPGDTSEAVRAAQERHAFAPPPPHPMDDHAAVRRAASAPRLNPFYPHQQ